MDSQLSKILLDGYQGGGSQVATELYARYAKRLAALINKRLSPQLATKLDSDDILQTAFQEFFAKADRGDVFWSREGDLWRLLAAICINHVKREEERYGAKKRSLNAEQPLVADRVHEHDLEPAWLAELMEEMFQTENSLTLQLVKSRLAGYTFQQIAVRTGRSERTVRRLLQRVKAQLASVSELAPYLHIGQPDAAYVAASANFNAKHEDFDLLKMLGAGSFGKVYLAKEERSGSLVAVKALRKSWIGDKNAESLFLNEAEVLSSIAHPNVVQFLDAGPLPNGSWFIVMEYVDGKTIDQFSFAKCDWRDVLALLCQIASALEALHAKGASHGDLKPSNIVVCENNAKLIDFGFASRRDYSARKAAGGTVGFLPPEMKPGPAADVYAFGKVLLSVVSELPESLALRLRTPLRHTALLASDAIPGNRPSAKEIAEMIGSQSDQLDLSG